MSSNQPLISVVIPTLNEEQCLDKLLSDLVNDTYTNKEIIVADSGSTDKTQDVASSYAPSLPLTFVRAPERGVSLARNTGAAHAQGEYLLFLDADTRLRRSYSISRSLEEMTERDLDLGVHNLKPFSRNPLDYGFCFVVKYLICEPLQYISPITPGGGNMIIKKAVHDSIGGFDESIVLAEDLDYGRRASKKGKVRMLRLEKALMNVRRFETEGRPIVWGKWSVAFFYHVLGGKAKKIFFPYKFGEHN